MDPEIQKIVDAAVADAVQKTREELNGEFERLKGLYEDSTKGLKITKEKIKEEKERIRQNETERLLKLADNFLKGQDKVFDQYGRPTDPVLIRRDASHAEYVRLKEVARQRGVNYRVVDTNANAPMQPVVTRHQFDFEEQTYVSKARIEELGGVIRARAHLPVGYIVFKSDADLTADAIEAAKAAGGDK